MVRSECFRNAIDMFVIGQRQGIAPTVIFKELPEKNSGLFTHPDKY